MPDEQPTPDPAAESDLAERDVIYLLTDLGGQRHWSVHEVGLELEDPGGAQDALCGLRRAGLVHRDSDGFVFATRQAIRYRELIGEASV